ncbi:single-stranded DNA-binding protein [Pygmaiobacter massiliensis]|uniref:single-stranded DNA-binding protein n=1 Tax=Pygmaiobacter massiliensis TaxID=1917873 RepID=UPI002A81FA0C|nr:single-stranded DNA-binding protein [Pygmaiobacter massiliensis]MDY4785496.1 single-stranded DNA-binding protein [Pygmaiobacter massiliensis]
MLNDVSLMGRLTADPELRRTSNGVSVTTFTIAVERTYTPQGQEKQADFIDIVAWRNTAEFVCKYFSKGRLIALNGSIQTRPYEDKEGHKRKAFEVVADNVFFCGDKAPAQASADISREAAPAFAQGQSDDFAVCDDNEDLPFN